MTSRRDVGELNVKTGLILTEVGTITNTGTLTLPTSTDTLVARNTSDTLTNKVLSGNTATNFLTGATDTISFPLSLSDTVVTNSNTATLTNKTLTGNVAANFQYSSGGNVISFPDIADTLISNSNTATLSNKTLTSPIINEILDSNSNELVTFSTVGASAQNYINVSNSIDNPVISAAGSSANIDLDIRGKGTGSVSIQNLRFPTSDGTSNQVLSTDGNGQLTFTSALTEDNDSATVTGNSSAIIKVIDASTGDDTYFIESKLVAASAGTGSNVDGAGYILRSCYRVSAGTAIQIGIDDLVSFENDTTWNVRTEVSGSTNIKLVVVSNPATGGTDTKWNARSRVLSLSG